MMFMEDGIAEKYINIYGAERMAFGTDYPLWDPVKETKRFLQLKLTDEQFEQIGHKTVERIFLRGQLKTIFVFFFFELKTWPI